MELGKIPPSDIEAEQAVLRKHANRQRCRNICNRNSKTRRLLS